MKMLDRDLYRSIGDSSIMSNFDNKIEENAEELLKASKVYGVYSAWDFNGNVWFEDGKFYCEVWQYRFHIDTIEANSLEEIMEMCSEKYGYR